MLRNPAPHPGTLLKELLKNGQVVMPGVFNAISAISATGAGAKALYLSGAGITNANLGVPDIALATLSEFAQQARYVTAVTPLPVISDADTGFGDALNVARTVVEMERAGLAGIHIEDQEMPKRCGHLDGKTVIPALDMERKLRAALASRRSPDFMIIARTDARGVEGINAAIERAKRYVAVGADAIFPEGLESEEEFEEFRASVPGPLLANMTEFGKTPIIPASRFESLGYQMVIFPMSAFRVMLKSLDEAYAHLVSAGTQDGLLPMMRTRAELYQRIGYAEYDAMDREWSNPHAEGRLT